MAFIIRQIARRADGGDIIRTRTLPAAEISVGRGTDCDIQLPDLGVMLRHARLVQIAPGRVAVEAIGGVPVEVGGRFVSRADLVVAEQPSIMIGSHRLSLEPGEGGAVAITAQRVIAAADADAAAAETGIFSLAGALPSRRWLAWAGALLVLGLLFAWPLAHFIGEARADLPARMVADAGRPGSAKATAARAESTGFQPDMVWSTGTLSNAHAGLSNNCGACHQQAFVSVRDATCQQCHVAAALPDHAPPARLAHGRVPESGVIGAVHAGAGLEPGRCTSCHREHEGPATVMTVAESFCTDCHSGLDGRLRDTALANVSGWDRHPEFKPTLVAAPAAGRPKLVRASLDTRPRENSGLVYPHALHLSASNAVANMAQKQGLAVGRNGALGCGYCHTPDADGVRFKPISMEDDCAACHDLAFARDGGVLRTLPHGKPEQLAGIIRDFWAARGGAGGMDPVRRPPGVNPRATLPATSPDAAVAAVFTGKGLCTECHQVRDTGTAPISRRFAIAPVSLNDHYLPKGRFPHGKHKSHNGKTGDAACIACHTGVTASKSSADVLLPAVASCRGCHGAPRSVNAVSASCDTCHGYHEGSHDSPATVRVAQRLQWGAGG
jgi:predicted CXXCH cytochrome family protein